MNLNLKSFAGLLVLSLSISFATAQEFKIESHVYLNESTRPVSEKITLFSGQMVYDFQMNSDPQPKPTEIFIWNGRERKINLLDPVRKVRLELLDVRLMKILETVKDQTVKDDRTKFLVEDKFTEEAEWSTNWVDFKSPLIEYRYHGKQPDNASHLSSYLNYLDFSTHLVATDPHKVPPFSKMYLNRSIRKLGWIPDEIRVNIKPNALFRDGLNAKSKHVLIPQLSTLDRQRITVAKQQWLRFKPVNLSEYRQLENPSRLPSRKKSIGFQKGSKEKKPK